MNTTSSSPAPSSPAQSFPAQSARERALVLGGGGSTGNAWLIGVVAGLLDGGRDAPRADLVAGPPAGPTAAAQITSAPAAGLLADILSATPPPRSGPAGSDRAGVSNRP